MVRTRPERSPHVPIAALAAWLGDAVIAGPEASEQSSEQWAGYVSGVALSTRTVEPGDLFVAPPGTRRHGATYVEQALAAGAAAVLTDPDGAAIAGPACASAGVPLLVVASPRALVGGLSAWLYDEPAAALRLLAVTGTQGKTTTTRLAEGALEAAGVRAAVVGTVGTRIAGADLATSLTTPEAPDLHALFAVMREQHVSTCAMEVSSHALVMGRVDGVVFDVAVFTNLGRDHLDFHTDQEDYFAAKAQLFTPERARRGLICIDDAWGRRLRDQARIPLRTYSVSDPTADWWASDIVPDGTGSSFVLHGPEGAWPTAVPIPGEFNVANAVAALASLVEAGVEVETLVGALPRTGGVPGRLEPVDAGQDFLAVVDYAHKPDAVEAVLVSLRARTAGRVIVVLGAGGDRDAGKRPLMGESAARLADVVVVTDDNPRSEDPASIRAAVLAGTRGQDAEVHEIGDRAEAIRWAVRAARPGDCVVVAGKGHERGQEVAGVVHPFDDRVVLREALTRRTGQGSGGQPEVAPEADEEGGVR